MKTTVIFVHGIGVRSESYEEAFTQVDRGLKDCCPDTTAARCFWGGEFGASLGAGGASIPDYQKTKGLTGAQSARHDEVVQLWDLLYNDPLMELRLFALRPGAASTVFAPGRTDPVNPFRNALQSIARKVDPDFSALLQRVGVSAEELRSAVERLTTDAGARSAFDEAARSTIGESTELMFITARALAALIAKANFEQGDVTQAIFGLPLRLLHDAEARDELVQGIAGELQSAKGKSIVGSWVKSVSVAMATRHVRARRGRYSRTLVPFVGDVLTYQAHGEAIREKVRSSVLQAKKEANSERIVLMGHSLGGIACVDLLALDSLCRSHVDRLVTVGSQAPLFFELNALTSCPNLQSLPGQFPEWLNIYDLSDFLSYIAEGVFGKTCSVEDVEVENGQPFPESHSAYWSNPQTWEAIKASLSR